MSIEGGDARRIIVRYLPCAKCGYNLNTLDAAGRCPECGTPIVDSIIGDSLEYADPRWLRQIIRGMSMLNWLPVWWVGMLVMGVVISRVSSQAAVLAFVIVCEVIFAFRAAIGFFYVCRAEPLFRRPPSVKPGGVIVRSTLAMLGIVSILAAHGIVIAIQNTDKFEYGICVGIAFAIVPLLVAPTLLHLAARLRDKRITWWLRIGSPLPLLLLLFYVFWVRKLSGIMFHGNVIENILSTVWLIALISLPMLLVSAWGRLFVRISLEQALAAANEFRTDSEKRLASGMIREIKNDGVAK